MSNPADQGERASVLDRLIDATNAHDLEAIVACFAPGYHNDTPVHPARSFTGRDQVQRNWEQILNFVPDIHATVLRSSVQDDVVWSEWEQRGTRRDGTPHLMRGVSSSALRAMRSHGRASTWSQSKKRAATWTTPSGHRSRGQRCPSGRGAKGHDSRCRR